MSNLVVVGFDEPHKAEEVRLKLQELQSEYLLDLADVVVAIKDESGKIKLHHEGNLISDTTVFQGFCGSLANLIVLNAAAGAASGALTDVGSNVNWSYSVIRIFKPCDSRPSCVNLLGPSGKPAPNRKELDDLPKG